MVNNKQPLNSEEPTSISLTKNRIGNWLKGLEEELGQPLDYPLNGSVVYLLLDCSISMASGSKLSQAKIGAYKFCQDAIAKGYAVGLIRFASSVDHITEPICDNQALQQHIDKLIADGSTNMAGAILLAIDKLLNNLKQRSIVIVTDGMPDNREAALSAAGVAKSKGIDIIAIGTDDADESFLRVLASRADLAVYVKQNQLEDKITSAAKLLPSR